MEGERGTMVRFDNDPFLSELMHMLKRNRQSGSVTVTMKRSCCLVRHIPAGLCTLLYAT